MDMACHRLRAGDRHGRRAVFASDLHQATDRRRHRLPGSVPVHFAPTSASWFNAVEGFFATLGKRRLKRGDLRSVVDLRAAINRFLDDHNAHGQTLPTGPDPTIIAAVRRGHQVLDHSG